MDPHKSAQSHVPTGGGNENHHGRLACQSCQRKKIKCSRTFPCEQCTRSGLQCIPSTRKPRTRHAGKRAVDSELRSRISKLESLVGSLSGDVNGAQEGTPGSDGDPVADRRESTSAVGKYIGSPFWSSLTAEVQALREAFEEEQSEDEVDALSPPTYASPSSNSTEYDLILCPPGTIYVMPGTLVEPPPPISAQLCETFISNVDCLFRLFHIPSLRAAMTNENVKYLGHDYHSAPCKAVRAAIWFSATNSMTDTQCHELLGQSRLELLTHFRKHIDIALSQADLFNTTDLVVLQALVTYVAALRLTDTSRRVWTMTALIVRIARAIGLHHESVLRTPFITELRRRLWFGIRFIDTWSSIDRATEQLIDQDSCDTPMPNNVNDEEFDESSREIPNHHTGLTSMSFSLMSHTACEYNNRLIKPEDKPNGETWQQRYEMALQFRKLAEDRFLKYCDTSDPFQRAMHYVGYSMINSMRLRAARPMQRHVSSVPPPVNSPFVLKIAIDCLRTCGNMDIDPEVQQWRWMKWVQWHALSIALAGLCFHRDNDLANEAWPLVQRLFDRNAVHVADTSSGMLWRPVAKLYKKAIAFRDNGTTASSEVSPAAQPYSTPQRPQSTSSHSADGSTSFTNPPSFNNAVPDGYNARNPMGGFTCDPPVILNHNGLPPGAMPTSGVDVDYSLPEPAVSTSMSFVNTMNWLDFEQILEDMSNTNIDNTMVDVQWSPHQPVMPPGHQWHGGGV